MTERQQYLNFSNITSLRFAIKTVTFSDEVALNDQQKEDDCSIIVKVRLNF